MNNLEIPLEQRLHYRLAGACKKNNLQAFKNIINSSEYSDYDKTQMGNKAFLAAHMDGNGIFLQYLILEFRIERTALVEKFLNNETLKFFNLRDLILSLEQLPINENFHTLAKI